MAVTQQFARIPVEYLVGCRRSADESPDGDPRWGPPPTDVLDLDWAPLLLERVYELGGLAALPTDEKEAASLLSSGLSLASLTGVLALTRRNDSRTMARRQANGHFFRARWHVPCVRLPVWESLGPTLSCWPLL
ncbi:hypothetical protein [Streptomyces monashensis]|uniref:hypothetical protein n=1 Tax=Streptomyces monashensis TaxID=1678012 RepID=UPI001FE365D7|nr:hypothetical protein [Streptomyces monashensis]